MRGLGYSLILLGFSFFLISAPADAEKYSETEFFLAKSGLGDIYDLEIDEPSEATPKYWKCRDDPNQANTFYPLVSWQIDMRGPLDLGDYYSYVFWVESTNVQEISFRTTLYIRTQEGYNNLSIDEVTKTSGFGSFLSENYTIELEESDIDKSLFPDGVPAYTELGLRLETSVTWAPDTDNRTVWVKGAHTDFLSSFIFDFKHVNIENDDNYFSNDRVDAIDEDSLFIKVNVTSALGADILDSSSAEIEIEGISGGGQFKDSILLKDKNTNAKYLQGKWWYQEDNSVTTGNYVIKFSLKDFYGNTWTTSFSYYLEVDQYDLEIEFAEGSSANGQLPKGGKTDYFFKILNTGNTRDIFMITIDDSDLPPGWDINLQSDSSVDLQRDQFSEVQIRVKAPVSARGGSTERVTITITSSGNENIFEEVNLDTTVRTYGVAFVSLPDEIRIDPDELDAQGYYEFDFSIRNLGSDKDTFELSMAQDKWPLKTFVTPDGREDVYQYTLSKSETLKIGIRIAPSNYDDSFGEPYTLFLNAQSISPGDASASAEIDLIMEIPAEKLIDLSVSKDEVLINNKPFDLLELDELQEGIPISIQLTINNLGGKSAGSFGVTLYEGSLKLDDSSVQQGIGSFGSVIVIFNIENPAEGLLSLKVNVDYLEQTDDFLRGNNKIELLLPIVEKASSGSSEDDNGTSLLFGPTSLLTTSVLVVISISYKRKK